MTKVALETMVSNCAMCPSFGLSPLSYFLVVQSPNGDTRGQTVVFEAIDVRGRVIRGSVVTLGQGAQFTSFNEATLFGKPYRQITVSSVAFPCCYLRLRD